MGKATDNLEAFVHPYDDHTLLVGTLTRATEIAKSLRAAYIRERGRAVETERLAAFTRAARIGRLRSAFGCLLLMTPMVWLLKFHEPFWLDFPVYIVWCLVTLGLLVWAAIEVENLA